MLGLFNILSEVRAWNPAKTEHDLLSIIGFEAPDYGVIIVYLSNEHDGYSGASFYRNYQNIECDFDSIIQSTLKAYEEVVSSNKGMNALTNEQIAIWQAFSIMTGENSGNLDYAEIKPFNSENLKSWRKWYNNKPDLEEFYIVIKVLQKIYSGDYSSEYPDFIQEIEKKNGMHSNR